MMSTVVYVYTTVPILLYYYVTMEHPECIKYLFLSL